MTVVGTALLVAAAIAAAASAVLWEVVRRREVASARSGAVLAGWTALAAALAGAVLMTSALVAHPAMFAYAERATEAGMPLYYRVTALWAGMEGSLLLWLVATALVAVLFAAASTRALPSGTGATAATVLNLATAAFAVVALAVHPFAAGGGPIESRPSPLLQDHPAMGLHPPLLYAGFTMLAVPYALAIGAAVAKDWSPLWRRSLHRWCVASWLPLTAGVGLGAWWSYAVLGWGGYWVWDPVENASLLPWLAATGLLHSIGRSTRRAGAMRWAVMFALLGYACVLLATYLTRSGVIASIHSFAISPIGGALLALVVVAVAAAAWMLMPRRLPPGSAANGPAVRHLSLVLHRWGVLIVLIIVLAGSILPTAVMALWGEQVAVGPPWYERVLAPIAFVLLLAMALGPWLARGSRRSAGIAAAATAGGLAVGLLGFLTRDVGIAVTGGLAVFVVVDVVTRLVTRGLIDRAHVGAAVAHIGVAVAAVSIVASGTTIVEERAVPIGSAVTVDDTSVTLVEVTEEHQQRRSVEAARVLVAQSGDVVAELRPELRWYSEHGVVLAGPEIRSEIWRDVYVTLLAVDPAGGTATIRLALNPMMTWLWGAGAVMIFGVAIAGWPSRRPGRPRARRPAEVVSGPAEGAVV